MVRGCLSAGLILALCGVAAPAMAQSLGEVARQEEARRASAKKATKSFSNADLQPSEIASPSGGSTPGTESCYMSISQNRCVSAEELLSYTTQNIASAELAKQEPHWRRQARTIRNQLVKAQNELETLSATASDQSRAPGKTAERMLALRRSVVAGLEQEWEELEKQAKQLRIPRAWLDPRPTLSPRIPQ